ncbi:hypothetical protein [Niastella populi]|uniref:Entericidin n=1 Tax=Niastella populi TaxID=550983 RepID=A0A1V9FXF2_9BACT|nr:hypothetical protein [Niastella populi]OQP62958.1 hypothetical protein A4R26_17410 [Niastella populi]
MKKLLLVLAIGSFVACNDGGSAEAEKTAADSAAIAPADTAAVTPAPIVDSSAHATDSAKVDSAAKK